MVMGMTVHDALSQLRKLDLPRGRVQHLAALIVRSTDSERANIVQMATDEAERAQEALEAVMLAAITLSQEWALRNPPARSTGYNEGRVGGGNYGPERVRQPEARPVVISWATPRRPEIVRPEKRPEQSEGFETTRADRARAQSPQPRKKRRPNGSPPECGTALSYVRGCRCEPCRSANTEYARERRARLKENENPENGTGPRD